jgi:ABC-type sugar transport system permease subunit
MLKKPLTRSQRRNLWNVAFVAPQLILYVGLTILPFFVALPIMFTDRLSVMANEATWVGFRNFVTIFQSGIFTEFKPALLRTVSFTFFNYLTVYLFGLTLALFMYEFRVKFQRIKGAFFTIIYLPWMVSGVGIGMLLIMLFSRDTGSMNLLLLKLGLIKKAVDIQGSELAVQTAMPMMVGWRAAGFNMALFLGGLLSIPEDTIDAAKIDGTNYVQRLRHVYIPQMIPSFIMATIFCLIGSFGVIDELVGMGAFYGNKKAQFVSIILFRLGFASHGSWALGTMAEGIALTVVVYVPLLILATLLIRYQRKKAY